MPRKKSSGTASHGNSSKAEIKNAGLVLDQPITKTLEINYMPYAMSVIVSRAIPEIDGFKPSHRKLLYTMYDMGLLNGTRTKSANVVGQTMKLNPHGDAAIYETLVRLSRGYGALLHSYVDSKGNFGKAYSRDMAYAASRYTEVRLDGICSELFRDIDANTVDFVDNYDNKMKEPTLLPVTFPNVLVNANTGIAVGMASSICSFNLAEVCDTAIGLIKNPGFDLSQTLKAPDFSGGGIILYDKKQIDGIYDTGRGSFKVRARYRYDKENNCLEITEIPPTTTVEAIIDKIVEHAKANRVREISDIRDETDLNGLKLTIDLKRGADPDRLMSKLYRISPLEDSFSCNFNVLVSGAPRVMGVRELLNEWTSFRESCVRRRLDYHARQFREKLHLLEGLAKILLDIDKAIRIVRETDEESEVVPNLMIGFGIDRVQADYVAEIKLRHLNREYILKRTQEIEKLKSDIADIERKLADRSKVLALIVDELLDVRKKFGIPRKSLIEYNLNEEKPVEEDEIDNYPVKLFLSAQGYFKKITPQSLRMSGEQKLKEGDQIIREASAENMWHLLFFTNKSQVYKARVCDFDDTKTSILGDYIPVKLGFDEGESIAYMAVFPEYLGYMLFYFTNGKAAKVDIKAYETKTNRRKLTGAYCEKLTLAQAFYTPEDREYAVYSSSGKVLLIHSGAVAAKTTRGTQGVAVMTLRPGQYVTKVCEYSEGDFREPHRYRTKTLPSTGHPLRESGGEQLSL